MSSDVGAATESDSKPRSDATALTVADLEVSYGKVQALKDVSFSVDEGEIVSVIGPNGAGKTTLSNTISGFLDYGGSVSYRGTEVSSTSPEDLVRDGLIQCTEERDLFEFMSVHDNLELGTYARGDFNERVEFVYDLFPILEEREEQMARTLSGGEQQMLAVGRSLMSDPELLVLDEPSLGLAPVVLEDISEGIETIRDSGVTIVLCEQNVTFALNHSDRIMLLENGEIVRQGEPEKVREDDYVRESYLGG